MAATQEKPVLEVGKDPDAILDYGVNWVDFLAGDTIADSDWDVPTDLTKETDTFAASSTTVWLSGGTAGLAYLVRNRITTTGGRTDDRTIRIVCKEK